MTDTPMKPRQQFILEMTRTVLDFFKSLPVKDIALILFYVAAGGTTGWLLKPTPPPQVIEKAVLPDIEKRFAALEQEVRNLQVPAGDLKIIAELAQELRYTKRPAVKPLK